MEKFPLGNLYSTNGVAALQSQEPGFVEFVWRSLERYKQGPKRNGPDRPRGRRAHLRRL